MFIAISDYTRQIDPAEPVLEAHRQWLLEQQANGVLVAAGPRDPWIGGVVIVRADDLDSAQTIMGADPFARKGVAVYRLTGFTPVLASVEALLPS